MLRSIVAKSALNRYSVSSKISSSIPQYLSTTIKSSSNSRQSFFSWSNNDGNNNSNNGNGKGSSDSKSKKLKADVENGDDSNPTTTTTSGGALPARLGFGDEAPRYPHLTALPLTNRPLFPGIVTSVTITDEVTIKHLEKLCGNGNGAGGYVGVFLRNPHVHGSKSDSSGSGLIIEQPELITDPNELYNVGTFAQIHRVNRVLGGDDNDLTSSTIYNINDDDEIDDNIVSSGSSGASSSSTATTSSLSSNPASVLLLAPRRIDLLSVDNIGPPIETTVSHWEKLTYKMGSDSSMDDTIRALSNEILKAIRELAQSNPLFRENVTYYPMKVDANDPYRLADFAASLTTGSAEDLQGVLEEKDAEMRLHKALVLLSKERELSKLQQEISRKVEEKMSEQQRKYMLHEQLKSIKKELGMEKDDKEALLAKYRKKISEFSQQPEQEVMETIESELEKLSTLEKNSSEFNVTRSYLDWLTSIPWGKNSKENFDIKDARGILDRDHYGLDEVKDTILQYIAVGKLKGTIQGKILCLSGPPGVGKTSIAESVADALGRKFYRFSVGGVCIYNVLSCISYLVVSNRLTFSTSQYYS